jgi:hypothetical protein
MDMPRGWDDNAEYEITVATDGSVVFYADYHSWVVTTNNELMILSGGGRDDGDKLLMNSYRSELIGIASGIAVLGTLARSGKIKVIPIKLVCDKEAAIKACNRKHMQSVFHRTEGGHDLISTIHYLQEKWCQDIEVQYESVKGHADDLNR